MVKNSEVSTSAPGAIGPAMVVLTVLPVALGPTKVQPALSAGLNTSPAGT